MMIVGFDVCHDICNKNISYGAFVATLNDTHTSYFSCVQPHRSGEELSMHFSISIASKWIQKNKLLFLCPLSDWGNDTKYIIYKVRFVFKQQNIVRLVGLFFCFDLISN